MAEFIIQVDRMSGDVPLEIDMKTIEGLDWHMPLVLKITRDDQTFLSLVSIVKPRF